MKAQTLREYCLAKPGTTEETPFGPDIVIYKVMGKMFLGCGIEDPIESVTVKCDPDELLFLRDIYPAVKPPQYLSKRHWNSVELDGSIPEETVLMWIDDSYKLVVKGLRKKDRDALEQMGNS